MNKRFPFDLCYFFFFIVSRILLSVLIDIQFLIIIFVRICAVLSLQPVAVAFFYRNEYTNEMNTTEYCVQQQQLQHQHQPATVEITGCINRKRLKMYQPTKQPTDRTNQRINERVESSRVKSSQVNALHVWWMNRLFF